jgi:hypothetical protein
MNHISTLELHRLRYGELDKARTAEVRTHIDACAACKERLQAQHAVRAEFEVLPVPVAIKEASRKPRVPAWVWALAPGLLVAALALVVVLPPTSQTDARHDAGPDTDASIDGLRYKSASKVELLREGSGVVDPKTTRFHPGDRIQVRVPPGRWEHAWLTDGEQILGRFPVEPGKATLAPFSLTLDDEPGAEHLGVVVSRELLTDDQIQDILRGRRMPGTDVTYVELQKTVP